MAVLVDGLQVVDESNEHDNQSFGSNTITISLPDLPDLGIDYWWASWDNITGDGVLEYTIVNNGTAPTVMDDWYINLMLSENLDPSIGDSYFLFYETAGFILNSGVSIIRDFNNPESFNLFWDVLNVSCVPSGTYYMLLWLDDTNLIDESNKINNVSTGNNVLTIYDNFLAPTSVHGQQVRASSSDSKGGEVTTNFNGKRLPKGNLLMRKVKIVDQPDGTRLMNFLGDEVHKTVQKTSEQSKDKIYSKVMTSADYAVFPRSSRRLMPETLEVSNEK